MGFTARHYEEVARIIKNAREEYNGEGLGEVTKRAGQGACSMIQDDLRRMFAADNPRFDGTRFDMACEPKGEK